MKYPIITTRGVIVFPGHSVRLNVGRKVSLNAIDHSIANNEAKIIIVSQKDISKTKITSEKEFFEVGTLCSLKITKELASGEKEILVTGLERTKISEIDFNFGQMLSGKSEIIKSFSRDEKSEKEFIKTISKQLEELMGTMVKIPRNVLSSFATGMTSSQLSDSIGNYAPFTFDKKQKLLETLEVTERLKLVNRFVLDQNQMFDIDKKIDSNVRSKLDNQQKEYLLRERMNAIKEELGEISSKDSEVDKWKKMLKDTKKYPKNVIEKLTQEIKRYEEMPNISAEANVSKGYIDWVINLPWHTYSKDNKDLAFARQTLEKHHFGLEKVKDRIIEYLAVKMNTESTNSPILTLVGPPGVGKTSLAKSIAEAMGKDMIKVSLGGIRDESEIRGHRRTYVGAMPGKIIQAMRKAKKSNPLILLDEIDKMSSDFRGDPTSAMLEVLDPEQNAKFQDHYIEEEYDLSKVVFIATANYVEEIPRPMLDRVELIRINQYTSEEKVQIAKNHLVKEVITSNGLKEKEFIINQKSIEFIVDKYTAEAGVRGLKRCLDKIARKIVVMKLEKNLPENFEINEESITQFLGKDQISKLNVKDKSDIGLSNGLYYSEVGGGVLQIEVTTYPSKEGGIKLTGSIKEVMQESLKIAVGYLRANAKKFNIDFDFDTNVIQVHVPEGALPKDGPSAGTAFTVAVLSALTKKPVKKNIAFTGEITLKGNVLKIGGLREKTIGAVEAGVEKIFIPKENKPDIVELSKKVKKLAKIIPVKSFEEIVQEAF